jgi:hypothetical protein
MNLAKEKAVAGLVSAGTAPSSFVSSPSMVSAV